MHAAGTALSDLHSFFMTALGGWYVLVLVPFTEE